MSELPPSAFRFDPELVRAFVQDRLDGASRATLADEVARTLPFHRQLPHPVIADLVAVAAAAELDRRAAELEHQGQALRDLVAPVAVRCAEHASG